jgi:hypothetical protein
LCFAALAAGAFAAPPEFNRDIRPILSDHCLNCHGQDAGSRKGGLRLDAREAALEGGKSGEPAIVPGKPEESALVLRLLSHDPDETMPPPKQNNPLTPAQIETLRAWIAAGAPYEAHWAFIPPQKKPLPGPAGLHPVDQWVRAALTKQGLSPAAEAPIETLARRIHLDVTGLPPGPDAMRRWRESVQKLGRQKALEALVDELLASPQFGEKWARHWLDAARYADSDGYEKDLPREQWAWRDWVIAALNRDLPYDRFLIEQIAGDLLPGAGQSQRIATGYLRNGMVNEEGAIIAEEFRTEGMFDRMDAIGKGVLGLTLQCAQCHTHKYDPLTHDEYFGLFAFLNRDYEATSRVYSPEQQARIAEVHRRLAQIEETMRRDVPDLRARIEAFAAQAREGQIPWRIVKPRDPEWGGGLAHPRALDDDTVLTLGFRPTHGELWVFSEIPADLGSAPTGLRLEALTHGDLPFGGPGRSIHGTFAISELIVEAQPPGQAEWKKLALRDATADFSEPDREMRPPFRNDKDGKPDARRIGPVAYLIDGKDETAWSPDRGIGRTNAPSHAVVRFSNPEAVPQGAKLKVTLKYRHGGPDSHGRHNQFLGRFRLAVTSAREPAADLLPEKARLAIEKSPAQWTSEDEAAVLAAWRDFHPDGAAYRTQAAEAWKDFPEARTTVLHLAQRRAEDDRSTYLLDRGMWNRPKHEVKPGVPAFLHPLPQGAEPNRLGLARWLADPRSPTTARVAVNRTWQAIFGRGLVATPEDFGVRAPLPDHPDLLDWLAVDFIEQGSSLKRLVRTILTSATYQQDSRVSPALLERDPANRWLARGPRWRADAEIIRDIALSASGLLERSIGGPSIFPPMPESVFAGSFLEVDFWRTATGADRYRRSLYVFRRRSMPDPAMASFDAPNGDFACVRRERSNTPLAALTALNEPVFVEAARALALRTLREAGPSFEERAAHAFALCTGRAPTEAERGVLRELLETTRARIAEGWIAARTISTGSDSRLPELPEKATPADAAAWTVVARVLLNLDETLTKN